MRYQKKRRKQQRHNQTFTLVMLDTTLSISNSRGVSSISATSLVSKTHCTVTRAALGMKKTDDLFVQIMVSDKLEVLISA